MLSERIKKSSVELENLTSIINRGDYEELYSDVEKSLKILSTHSEFSQEALLANVNGLKYNDWNSLSDMLVDNSIFSMDKIALIAAPYHVRRPNTKTKLSLLVCEKLEIESFPFNYTEIHSKYNVADYKPITPINIIYSAGNISGNTGETFIVPTAWKTMPLAGNASPYLDISGSQNRLKEMSTDEYMHSLYDNKTAETLIKFKNNTNEISNSRLWEYSLHEYGHAQGSFVDRMKDIKGNMEQAALEEWRSDGFMAHLVDMHVKSESISKEQGHNILMSNFLTRFGMDVVRNKNKIDHDVLASYYILGSLESTGLIDIQDNKLNMLGDTTDYNFWSDLYSNMATISVNVTNEVSNTKGKIDKKIVPELSISLDDFVTVFDKAAQASLSL